jgi:hypothetical protein
MVKNRSLHASAITTKNINTLGTTIMGKGN